ncbi:MAG TPA: DUF167 family protein [Rhizomicrobium sp.]|nr:DUF167 family protein [Rhizomicrobium sp.]
MTAKPYHAVPGGVRLAVRLTPRGGRDALDGVGMDAQGRPVLQIRLAAPPVEGAANEALIAFLAELLDLRKKDVVLRSGHTARTKIVELTGTPDVLLAHLAKVI